MPPELDVYAITRHRDRATIERFLDEYVDRDASEDRSDEELILERLTSPEEGHTNQWAATTTESEHEPSRTLSHIIDRGLDHPRRAFTTYLTAKAGSEVDRVILAFTRDDQLVLGLAIEYAGAPPERLERANALLAHLIRAYACHAGVIVLEHYPPHSEREFHAWAENPNAIYITADRQAP